MTAHVMLDIETLGKGNYAALWTIGAVKFNPLHVPETKEELIAMTERFTARCDLKSVLALGLRMDASTIEWWMASERDEARTELLRMPSEDIRNVLSSFAEWYGETPMPTWGNGAMFDNVIVTNAFTLANVPMPWTYKEDRCYRTIKELVPCKRPDYGVKHGALDDAMAQAWHLQFMVKMLRVGGGVRL